MSRCERIMLQQMARHPESSEPSLLISSAPLGWPNIIVETRLFKPDRIISWPAGHADHRIMIWQRSMECALRIGGRDMPLSGYNTPVVIVPARTPFRAVPRTPERFTKLCLSPAFVDTVARESLGLSRPTVEASVVDGDADLRAIGHLLTEAVTGHQPLDGAMIALIVRETAIHLICNYSDMRRPRTDLRGRIPSTKLVRVLDYIGANLHRTLRVGELAREAGLSQAHFARAFARSTGRSPHAYLSARRIAKAGHLLRYSDQSLDQIAADCGFHDQAHFSRAFKATMHATPRAYRKFGSPRQQDQTPGDASE